MRASCLVRAVLAACVPEAAAAWQGLEVPDDLLQVLLVPDKGTASCADDVRLPRHAPRLAGAELLEGAAQGAAEAEAEADAEEMRLVVEWSAQKAARLESEAAAEEEPASDDS